MKVFAFNGSPRKGGNIDLLLAEAERAVNAAGQAGGEGHGHEWTRFDLNTMNIRACQDCGGCEKTGACVINDDMVQIRQAIRDADRIILASPVFFFGLSAQTKAMIDRCQAFWCEKYLLKRPLPEGPFGRKGLLLLVGGMKKEVGIQCSETTATGFFQDGQRSGARDTGVSRRGREGCDSETRNCPGGCLSCGRETCCRR